MNPPVDHFVTIRLEYHQHSAGRTPWKRRGWCICGWQCLSWDGLRPILIAAEHVALNRQSAEIVDGAR
jgi:hypothetical protein